MKKSIKRTIISVTAIAAISAASVFGASAACINPSKTIGCTNNRNMSKIILQQSSKNYCGSHNCKITINGVSYCIVNGQLIENNFTEESGNSDNSVNTDTPKEDSNTSENTGTQDTTQDTTQSASSVSEIEKEVVTLVNEIRVSYGLSELALNEELSSVARAKAQDMATNGYFSHTSPTYGSPFDMMSSFGIAYRSAGENIASGYKTAEAVVDGWMNSEGHRANILNSSFTQIGVGYVANGNLWAQMFIG